MLKIYYFILLLALSAGGGGGGGGGGSVTGYDFTTTRSLTRGMVSVIDFNSLGQTPDVHSEEVAFTSEKSFGGFNFRQNICYKKIFIIKGIIYFCHNQLSF